MLGSTPPIKKFIPGTLSTKNEKPSAPIIALPMSIFSFPIWLTFLRSVTFPRVNLNREYLTSFGDPGLHSKTNSPHSLRSQVSFFVELTFKLRLRLLLRNSPSAFLQKGCLFFRGTTGIRTWDTWIFSPLLYQLSYSTNWDGKYSPLFIDLA